MISQKFRPYRFNILLSIQITCSLTYLRLWQKRRIVNSTKPTIRRLNFCDIYFLKISVHVCISVAQQENAAAILPKIWKSPCSSLGEQGLSSMEKQKNFPGLLCPESLEDTAFDAMSSKLADNDVITQHYRFFEIAFKKSVYDSKNNLMRRAHLSFDSSVVSETAPSSRSVTT